MNRKIILFCLAAIGLSGCVTRNIEFISQPSGIEVTVQKKSCTTPCSMNIDKSAKKATFTINPEHTTEIDLPEYSKLKAAKRTSLQAGEKSLKAFSIPFGILGSIGLGIILDDNENNEDSNDKTESITIGSLSMFLILYCSGDLFKYFFENQQEIVEFNFNSMASYAAPTQNSSVEKISENLQIKQEDFLRVFPNEK